MLNAPPETTTTLHVATRQPQARDRQPPTSFSSLVDDNAAAEADPSPSRPPRSVDTGPRTSGPQRTRDSREQDDRAPRDTESADHASAPRQIGSDRTSASTEKPAEATGESSDKSATDTPTQPAIDIDAAAVDPILALPATTPAEAVIVAVPVVVAPPPAPVVAPTVSVPLAIAAAGIAAAKAAAKPSEAGPTDDTSDQPTPSGAADALAAAPAAENATTVATVEAVPVKVETGFPKPANAKPAPVETSEAPAPAARKAEPKTAAADVKPKDFAAGDDAKPAPAAPAQPHDHRAVAASPAATLDAAPNGPQTAAPPPTTPAAAVSPTAQLTATAATPVPLNGLAIELTARAQSGASRFEIRLDPADLGRIDVRIDIDRHGQVTSHLTVEKPETLAMLRQDSPQLQRALNDAGLKTADGGLQFTLGDQSQPRQNTDGGERQAQRFIIRDNDTVAPATQVRGYGRMFAARGGVDISV